MFELMPMNRRDRDMFRAFDDFEKNFFGLTDGGRRPAMGFSTDVIDEGDCYRLEAELPGFDKEDISVNLEGDTLTIRAEHKENKEDKSKGYVYRERRFGSFSRSFDVSGIDENGITGDYQKGLLVLKLPKEQKPQPRSKKIEL